MTEAIFAGEEVKEFPRQQQLIKLAFTDAVFPGLAKDLFLRNCPADAGNRNGEGKQPGDLCTKLHNGLLKLMVQQQPAYNGCSNNNGQADKDLFRV